MAGQGGGGDTPSIVLVVGDHRTGTVHLVGRVQQPGIGPCGTQLIDQEVDAQFENPTRVINVQQHVGCPIDLAPIGPVGPGIVIEEAGLQHLTARSRSMM